MSNKYTDLAEFRKAKTRARQEREHYAANIAERWVLLKEPRTRGALLRDALGDLLHSWKPYRRVHELLNGRVSGSTVSTIGMAIASLQGGFVKRMLWSGVSMLLGKLIGEKEEQGPGFLSTLATAIGGMVQRVRERKAKQEEEDIETEAADREPSTADEHAP